MNGQPQFPEAGCCLLPRDPNLWKPLGPPVKPCWGPLEEESWREGLRNSISGGISVLRSASSACRSSMRAEKPGKAKAEGGGVLPLRMSVGSMLSLP